MPIIVATTDIAHDISMSLSLVIGFSASADLYWSPTDKSCRLPGFCASVPAGLDIYVLFCINAGPVVFESTGVFESLGVLVYPGVFGSNIGGGRNVPGISGIVGIVG